MRFCLAIVVATLSALGSTAHGQLTLSADSLSHGIQTPYLPMFKLRQGWRFREGHDPAFSSPDYDDSGWAPVSSPFPEFRRILPNKTWRGSGWFRLRLRLAEDVRDLPLVMLFSILGAGELYVDGERLLTIGRVGVAPGEEVAGLATDAVPTEVVVDPDGRDEILLAVRMSNFWSAERPHVGYYAGFDVAVNPLDVAGDRMNTVLRTRKVSQVFFGASIGSIALLHVLFFAFYPHTRRNLLYAIYAFCLAISAILPLEIYVFADDPFQLDLLDLLWKLTILATIVAGHAFIYTSFSDGAPAYTRWALIPIGVLLLTTRVFPVNVYYAVLLVTFPELIRAMWKAIRQGREGARIVSAGFGCLILLTAHVLLMELGVIDHFTPNLYLYGFLCLILSMAIYLARDFARTGRELRDRVGQVQGLSERKVEQERVLAEQERQRQEAETRRRVLEAENAATQVEIEASRRRREVLERIEETTKQIRQTEGRLVQSEKMAALGNLVAGIAHEINTPVGAINSMHDTLLRAVDRLKADLGEGEDERLGAALQVMDRSNEVISSGTVRVTEIVRSLRTFARLDDAEMSEVDLRESIDGTLPLIQHHLNQGIEIVKDYGEIPQVTCYPSRLNQVFLNVLVNAAEAIDGAGTITVRTRADEQGVTVSFTDTGAGIEASALSRVFDPGYTTKGVGVGTGLGLSICYQIVQDHHGTIAVESEVGTGTTVTVTLPTDAEVSP